MEVASGKGSRGRLAAWWHDPPRTGVLRLIPPYEFRRLRLFGLGRFAGGVAATVFGSICLAYSADGWAALFLAIGAVNLVGGLWLLSIADAWAPHVGAPVSSGSGRP